MELYSIMVFSWDGKPDPQVIGITTSQERADEITLKHLLTNYSESILNSLDWLDEDENELTTEQVMQKIKNYTLQQTLDALSFITVTVTKLIVDADPI
jgi:hypothetical protein